MRKIVLMYPMDEHVNDYLGRFDRQPPALFTYSINYLLRTVVLRAGCTRTARGTAGTLPRGEHTLFSLTAGAANASSDAGNRTAAHGVRSVRESHGDAP